MEDEAASSKDRHVSITSFINNNMQVGVSCGVDSKMADLTPS